jgi:bidirectional [NiFe] hydrogenase diaphorase subunit
MAAAEGAVGVGAGKTTADGRLSLASARCLGACGIAPAVVIDGTVAGHATPEDLAARLAAILANPST